MDEEVIGGPVGSAHTRHQIALSKALASESYILERIRKWYIWAKICARRSLWTAAGKESQGLGGAAGGGGRGEWRRQHEDRDLRLEVKRAR